MISRKISIGAALLALGSVLAGCSGNGTTDMGFTKVTGESATVGSSQVTTEANYRTGSTLVQDVTFTVPMDVINNPPTTGTGNANALAMVDLPSIIQGDTFLNHVEMHWYPAGHSPAHFQVPLFDFDFFAVPKATVSAITTPDTVTPDPSMFPDGFTWPGGNTAVAEMGTQVFSDTELNNTHDFLFTMALLYSGGKLIGLEPMIAQSVLQSHQTVIMNVPRPFVLGQQTQYPTRFTATYDPAINAYRFRFSNFVAVLD